MLKSPVLFPELPRLTPHHEGIFRIERSYSHSLSSKSAWQMPWCDAATINQDMKDLRHVCCPAHEDCSLLDSQGQAVSVKVALQSHCGQLLGACRGLAGRGRRRRWCYRSGDSSRGPWVRVRVRVRVTMVCTGVWCDAVHSQLVPQIDLNEVTGSIRGTLSVFKMRRGKTELWLRTRCPMAKMAMRPFHDATCTIVCCWVIPITSVGLWGSSWVLRLAPCGGRGTSWWQ